MKTNQIYRGLMAAVLFVFLFTACVSANPASEAERAVENQSNADEANQEADSPSPLYLDFFLSYTDHIGTMTYNDFVNAGNTSPYNLVERAEHPQGVSNLRLIDEAFPNAFVTASFYFKQNQDVLTMLSYGNTNFYVTASNNLHTTPLQYATYAMIREPATEPVDSAADFRGFFDRQVPQLQAAYEKMTEGLELLEVDLCVEEIIRADNTISFQLNTNLPNDTELVVLLTDALVETPSYEWHTLVWNGSSMIEVPEAIHGTYSMEITMSLPSEQSQSVREVIGFSGEFLTGRYVVLSDIEDSNIVHADFSFEL